MSSLASHSIRNCRRRWLPAIARDASSLPKAEPFPDDRETFLKRHGVYEGWATDGRFVVINSERTIDEVHEELVTHVPGISS